MIYLQPITFYAIMREMEDPDRTEIAEHPDGAMKAYADKCQAHAANNLMPVDEGWRVDEILMVPPPMTAAARKIELREEVEELKAKKRSPTS